MSLISQSRMEEKKIKYNVSDDTLDYLDTQVDEFNDTNNLTKKIAIHRNLQEITKSLIDEIDNMVEIIDNIDQTVLNSEFYDTNDNNDNKNNDINDDIINVEEMINNMEEEESMEIKISHYKRITDIVKKCRLKCDIDQMNILNVNN